MKLNYNFDIITHNWYHVGGGYIRNGSFIISNLKPHNRCLSSILSHKGPAKKASPVKAGSHYLYYQLNNLNAEKSYPSGDLKPKQHPVYWVGCDYKVVVSLTTSMDCQKFVESFNEETYYFKNIAY